MKSYYHAHETAYQQIRSKGNVGWGNAKSIAELGDEATKEYLRAIVSEYFPKASEKSALDVGCGTGTTAFVLAKMGFNVTGVDISDTAISMGRELAEKQNLKIEFKTADVLELHKLNQKFDLIYDSHCLHCIVFEEDRIKVLRGAREALMADGIFILDTMIMPEIKYSPADGFDGLRFDDDYILWHKTKPSADRGFVEVDGQYWCAQRRIYPPAMVMKEIAAAGFNVLKKQIDVQPNEPSMLRLVLAAANP